MTKEGSLGVIIILLIILIEGFVTIAVEMMTIRQLIPVVGNSVVITSLIIGIFLLFLALGYHRGGQYRENYHQVLKNNFTLSAALLGIGLSYIVIELLFDRFYSVVTSNALFVLIFYLLFITAPLVYILGQTVPITTNLFKYEHHVGTISGKVLSLSTLGSFLGSVFTTLVLMNFLGVAWTVFINYLLLVFLTFILIDDYIKEFWRVFILIVVGILVFALNVGVEHQLKMQTNNYGNYEVISNYKYGIYKKVGKIFYINDSSSSFLSDTNKGFNYIELIKRILFQDLKLTNKDILALGAGGFTLSAESDFGNRFLYVDIDRNISKIAKQEGFIDKIKGKFVGEDARKFLMETPLRFDVVVSDVYSNKHAIPFHLLTKEYFQDIKNVLRPKGIAVFNIITSPILNDAYSKRIDNTLRSVFNNCMVIPLEYTFNVTNLIYVCYPHSPFAKDRTIYTDNLNPSTLDFFRGPRR